MILIRISNESDESCFEDPGIQLLPLSSLPWTDGVVVGNKNRKGVNNKDCECEFCLIIFQLIFE